MARTRTEKQLNGNPTTRQRGLARFVDDLEAALFEFVGTVLFLLIALGGVQAVTLETASSTDGASLVVRYLYIATCFGLSLLVSAWLFFRATGGLFNPNVTLALLLCRVITPVRFVLCCIAQLVGAIVAAALVLALLPGPLTSNPVPSQGVNSAQAVFIEMFITGALCLSVLMLGAEKHEATPFAPVGVGLTLFACHLFALPFTGAAMNTARAFGPAVVTGFPSGRHWIYWVGPGLGSLLGTALYYSLKWGKYWQLNPGADATREDKSPDCGPSPPMTNGGPQIDHDNRV